MANQFTELELAALMLADDERCHYDHHGYCQTHFLHERPCPMELINECSQKIEESEQSEGVTK